MKNIYFIYGPPGSGKTTVGRMLADRLRVPFVDLDEMIERKAGCSVGDIFQQRGEAFFRRKESAALKHVVRRGPAVVALGGGALLNTHNRAMAEAAGRILFLDVPLGRLAERAEKARPGSRPLLGRRLRELRQHLESLLARRAEHYASFHLRLKTDDLTVDDAVAGAETALGAFRVEGMGGGYDVRVVSGGLDELGLQMILRGLEGPVALVGDMNTDALFGDRAALSLRQAGYIVTRVVLPTGETYKHIGSIQQLWAGFLRGGLERSSTVVALGGGVVGDMAGFAAATYLRGVRWVNVPTTLLSMVDSSLGGKTGADLPEGKNLVGAFHAPSLVLADPQLLASLPEREWRGGLAEVVKHGIIGDSGLFEHCEAGWNTVRTTDPVALVCRAMAVKIRVIRDDPFEKGLRASLNLGHTVGHAVETVAGYRLSHGEAISIGMVEEARLSEKMRLAHKGLAYRITAVLSGLGLPTVIPAELSRVTIRKTIAFDKKKSGGVVKYALPVCVGEVRVGVRVKK